MKILIVDDDVLFAHDLAADLREHSHDVETIHDAEALFARAPQVAPDIVLCDWDLRTHNGTDVLRFAHAQFPEAEVIIVTAFGSMENAVASFHEGACDFLVKPVMIEDLLFKIRRIDQTKAIRLENKWLRRQLQMQEPIGNLIGNSPQMQGVMDGIRRVAAPNTPVLIRGESGTGKELVARAIHDLGRPDRPFVAFNSAALPEHLVESQLFGHVQGAFTGATTTQKGLLEAAGEGTVFFDEIADATLSMQAKLLRALDQRQILRVGDIEERPIKARFLFATHQDLQARVKAGQFREDLLYRIQVMTIDLPPLRERPTDIPHLVAHFIQTLNLEIKTHVLGITTDALRELQRYSWPGNVRELRNVIERALIFAVDGRIQVDHLPQWPWADRATRLHSNSSNSNSASADGLMGEDILELRAATRRFVQTHIRRVLELVGNNVTEAARLLRIDRRTVYRKLENPDDDDDSET